MGNYRYIAIETATGRTRRGSLEGASREDAVGQLKARGFAPLKIEAEAKSVKPSLAAPVGASQRGGRAAPSHAVGARLGRFGRGRPVSRKSLMVFTRQLATLVKAGMPLARCLDVLRRQERQASFRDMLEDLGTVIGAGGNFSDGLARYPRTFDALYVNMVKAGEAGGVLGTVLERLAGFMEKSERLKARVKAAMIYPAIIMAVAGGIVAVLMVFVVPKFELIFSGLLKGQPLPPLTRGLLGVSGFLRDHLLLTAGAVAGAGVAVRLFRKTAPGMRGFDWVMIKAPVMGDLALKASVARFSRTLGSLLASGVSILEALLITRNTAGNVHVTAALEHVHDRIKQGDTISRPLEATAIFPGMVTGMIQVGEETGALPEMLNRIADTYDDEVDNAVAGLTSVIEPIMIVLMALVVGAIVMALFLPIVSVIEHLQ